MSLQVWLPLTGDLRNNGLADVTFSATTVSGYDSSGKIGKAMQVLNSNVVLTADALNGVTAFSVAFWYKAKTNASITTNWCNILALQDETADKASKSEFRFESSYGTVKYAISHHDNSYYPISAGFGNLNVNWDTWNHVCVTCDGDSKLYLYVNGEKRSTYANYNGGHLTGVIKIANEATDPDGSLNDLRIYDHVLTSKEVKELSKAMVMHYKLSDPLKTAGENIILNGLPQSASNWYPNSSSSSWDFTTKNGCNCIHFSGAFNTSKSSTPKFTTTNANNYLPTANQYCAFSADVLFENVVKGNVNHYIDLYPSGTTIDGTWRGYTSVSDSGHFKSYNGWKGLDADILNGKGWIHVWRVFQYGNYNWTTVGPCLYARDFTGDVYFKNIKFEIGNKVTLWTPSPSDSLYTTLGLNGNTIYDSSGYQYNGTSTAVTFNNDSPRYGSSVSFDGSTSYIELTELYCMPAIVSNDWTFSFWVYNNDSGGRSVFFSDYQLGGVGGISFGFEKTVNETLRVYSNNGALDRISPNAIMPVGQWTHIAATKNGNNFTVYKNGVQVDAFTNSNCTSPGLIYRFGRDNRSDATMFKGRMSDFRCYATPFSANDILELYNSVASGDRDGNFYAREMVEV